MRSTHSHQLHHDFLGLGHLTRQIFIFFFNSIWFLFLVWLQRHWEGLPSAVTKCLKRPLDNRFLYLKPQLDITRFCLHVHSSGMCSCLTMTIYQLSRIFILCSQSLIRAISHQEFLRTHHSGVDERKALIHLPYREAAWNFLLSAPKWCCSSNSSPEIIPYLRELQISKTPFENCRFQLEISHNINLQLDHQWETEK